MNRRTSLRLRLRLLGIGRDYDDRQRGHVLRYAATPTRRETTRRRTPGRAVREGQTIVLLTFLLLVVLGTVMTAPTSRTLVQEVVSTTSTPQTP